MNKADQYAQWIVANQDKQGTPEFETVAKAYQEARSLSAPSTAQPVNASYEAGRKVSDPLTRGFNNALAGPTFGFWDELAGAISAPVKAIKEGKSLTQSYQEGRDYVRGVQDQYKQDFPVGSTVTQLMTSAPELVWNPAGKAGMSLLSAVAPKAAAWLSPTSTVAGLAPTLTRAAVSGGGYGALNAAGESKADSPSGVVKDALNGAVTGAVTAGALQTAQSGLGAVVRNVAQRTLPGPANSYAQQKVAEALSRDARGSTFTTGQSNPANQATSRFNKLGSEATVADAGGENTRQLLDTVATLPGQTKNAAQILLRERQGGRGNRLIQAADDALGTHGAGYQQTLDALDAVRRNAAAPFYDKLNGLMVQVDDDVMHLLGRTMGNHAEAQRLYQLQTGQAVKLADLKKGDQVPFAMLDTLKQSLYDAADTAKRQGSNKMGRALDDVRTSLTNKLDALAPTENGQSIYKLARDAYAGPSQLVDAAELGRTAMKADTFDVAAAIKGMSASEAQAFRVGALQALREKAGTQSGQTSLLRMWMEPSTQTRIKQIFGKDYREFASEVAKEARLKGLEGVGKGSQSASRLFGAGDLDVAPMVDVAQTAASAAHGNPLGVVAGATRMWNRVQTPEPVRDQIGQILLSQGQAGAHNLQSMQDLIQRINRQRATQATGFGLLGGYGAGSTANGGGLLGDN